MGVPIENIQVGNELHPLSAQTLNTPASIDGVAFDGGESITHYTVCSTAAGTAEKTISVGGEYTRDSGSAVRVKFTYANTASNPTLDVNNTGAAPISVYGDQNADSATWQAGETLDLVFDGTRWQIVGGGIASTTIRGRVKLDATPTSGSNNAPSSGGVYAQLALKAPLASPALTGTPTAPTASPGDNSTKLATTAYVDAAVAVEKARAEAVEATKADQSFAEYILLREEEDRQILFGSVVEAAEDSYPELRSSPIHNAITIGGSVYPRMDRTRMAIDRILGRTVAFNQLAALTIQSGTYDDVTITVNADHSITVSWEAVAAGRVYDITAANVPLIQNHVYYAAGGYDNTLYITNTYTAAVDIRKPRTIVKSDYTTKVSKYRLNIASRSTAGSVTLPPLQLVDLTAQYGTTLADSIYAMEQATAGAGVAYVRQRMDLDYYAANAGELKAPVVSGVTVTGFNVWDEEAESGDINAATGANVESSSVLRSKNYIPCFPNTAYYYCADGSWASLRFYDANKNFLVDENQGVNRNALFTTPSNAAYMRFVYMSHALSPICINLSKTTGTPKNGDYLTYQRTSLSLPSTRLDGVGTAQDVMYVREDGENDYSLIKRSAMGLVDLGTLNWLSNGSNVFYTNISGINRGNKNAICSSYVQSNQGIGSMPDKTFSLFSGGGESVWIKDTAYTDAAAFKTAMDGVMFAYELTTPTETVIAEHLTLAEVSAIAENGGIISVVNENGHIVQPDCVMDTVISRSAS